MGRKTWSKRKEVPPPVNGTRSVPTEPSGDRAALLSCGLATVCCYFPRRLCPSADPKASREDARCGSSVALRVRLHFAHRAKLQPSLFATTKDSHQGLLSFFRPHHIALRIPAPPRTIPHTLHPQRPAPCLTQRSPSPSPRAVSS